MPCCQPCYLFVQFTLTPLFVCSVESVSSTEPTRLFLFFSMLFNKFQFQDQGVNSSKIKNQIQDVVVVVVILIQSIIFIFLSRYKICKQTVQDFKKEMDVIQWQKSSLDFQWFWILLLDLLFLCLKYLNLKYIFDSFSCVCG